MKRLVHVLPRGEAVLPLLLIALLVLMFVAWPLAENRRNRTPPRGDAAGNRLPVRAVDAGWQRPLCGADHRARSSAIRVADDRDDRAIAPAKRRR